jgi:hypothetical protein
MQVDGGPQGFFTGTNSETGGEIWGYMDWREDVWEMHVVFTRDIQQDYLIVCFQNIKAKKVCKCIQFTCQSLIDSPIW